MVTKKPPAPAAKKSAPGKAAASKKAASPIAKKASKKSATRSYQCTFFSQRDNNNAPTFCVFAAAAGDVLKWADIERLGPGVQGVQRRENVAKRRQITKFFENDTTNTIPTAVIIAFDKTLVHKSTQTLTVPIAAEGQRKVGLVIDGQHRLLGIRDYDPDIELPVVGILDADDVEKAFQFLVINNKGSKVSQNHIKALALSYKPKLLADRLKIAKIALDKDRLIHVDILNTADDSPFRGHVDFPTTKGKNKKIVPEAFEKALQYIEALNLPKLEDADVQRDFFLTIWKSIISVWKEKNVFDPKCKLTDKVGIVCMTRYMVDRLASMADMDDLDLDLSDMKEVAETVEKNLKRQTLEFWVVDWKGSGYDTGIGHTKVLENLTRISRNVKAGKEWETDLDILKSG